MQVTLHPHQQKAVNDLSNGKILWGDVGTGKTLTALAYFYTKVCKGVLNDRNSMRTPCDIYVITTAKKRDSGDWQEDAYKIGIGKNADATTQGCVLTVDSWNNIEKYENITNAFFVFDEQRVVGSGSWTKSFLRIAKHNQWILCTATPGDNWLDYIPVFVANGFYRNRTEFKGEHTIYSNYGKYPKLERYVGVNKLVRHKNALLVEMPYVRHTRRVPHEIECDYDRELFERVWKDRWHVYENRPLRDVSELFIVARKVVNSDESRLANVANLLLKHPKVIVFYNFDYELEMLRMLVPETQMASPESLEQLKARIDSQPRGRKTSSSKTSSSTESIPPPHSSQRKSEFDARTGKPSCGSSAQSVTDVSSGSVGTVTSVEGASECLGSMSSKVRSGTKRPVDTKRLKSNSPKSSTDESLNLSENSASLAEWCRDPETIKIWGICPEHPAGGETLTSVSQKDVTGNPVSEIAADFSVAEWNGHKHERIPDTDRWLYLVQYAAGAEGWNCVETDAMVFWSQTYSYKMHHQAHGRIDRLNTPFSILHYYYFKSVAIIDKAIGKALSEKKTFNERSLVPR